MKQPTQTTHIRAVSRTVRVAPEQEPLYLEAKQAFSQRDFVTAQKKIEILLANVSPNDTAKRFYYERQRELCRQAQGLPAPASSPSSVSTVPPDPANADCGPRALLLATKSFSPGTQPSLADVRQWAGTRADGTTLTGLQAAAKRMGLKATGVQMDEAALAALDKPAIAWKSGTHFMAILKVSRDLSGAAVVTVHDPNEKDPKTISVQDLLLQSGGILLTLEPQMRTVKKAE